MCIKHLLDFFKKKSQPVPPPEQKKWAKIYMNADFVNVQTLSGYGMFFPDPAGDNIFFNVEIDDILLGEAILKALEKSQLILPNTPEDEQFFANGRIRDFYPNWMGYCKKTYGYKTKKALYRDMKNVGVEGDDTTIILDPWHQEKPGAFGPTKNKEADNVIIPADSSPEEVGKAVRLALSRCTSEKF